MTDTYALAALWIGLALAAALASIRLRVATALSEIVVGTLAGAVLGTAVLGADQAPSCSLSSPGRRSTRMRSAASGRRRPRSAW